MKLTLMSGGPAIFNVVQFAEDGSIPRKEWKTGRLNFQNEIQTYIHVLSNEDFVQAVRATPSFAPIDEFLPVVLNYQTAHADRSQPIFDSLYANVLKPNRSGVFTGLVNPDIYINYKFYNGYDPEYLQAAKVHEITELYYASKPGFNTERHDDLINQESLAKGQQPNSSKYLAHRLAVRRELDYLNRIGLLEDQSYIDFMINLTEPTRGCLTSILPTPLWLKNSRRTIKDTYFDYYKRLTGRDVILPSFYRGV